MGLIPTPEETRAGTLTSITAPAPSSLQPQVDKINQGVAAYNASANPPAPPTPTTTPTETTPTPTPISRTISDPNYDAAQKFLDTSFKTPQTAEQIAEQKRQDSQALIDSINKQYDDKVAASKVQGDQRVSQTDATSVLAGLMGSTEAGRVRTETTAANQKAIDAVNNERALALSSVYTKISADAETEARQQLLDANKNAQDVVDRRTKAQTDAVTNLKTMASGGLVDFESFKNSPQNAKVYQYALDSVGGSEDALRAIFAINRPQDQIVGTPTRVGDHFVQAYKNPITGKVSYENIPLPPGMGPEYKTFQKMGDNLVAIPDGWDGDVTKLKTIAGTPSASDLLDLKYKQAQIDKIHSEMNAGNSDNGQLYNGLSAHTSTAVRARVNKYASDNTIQNFSTVQDGYNFAKSLNSNTKNPADDQALIYSLAKALDPGSVVREGEYATAQKYAQSWVAAYGTGISQALLGTGFLSKTARDNIKATITEKYNSQKRSYDQTRGSYIQGINALTGRSDGEKFITEYETPDQNGGSGISVTDPTGGVHSFPDQKSADAFKKAAGIQ